MKRCNRRRSGEATTASKQIRVIKTEKTGEAHRTLDITQNRLEGLRQHREIHLAIVCVDACLLTNI